VEQHTADLPPQLRDQEPDGWSVLQLVSGVVGFPWGLLLTPIQIGRNVFGIVHPPEP